MICRGITNTSTFVLIVGHILRIHYMLFSFMRNIVIEEGLFLIGQNNMPPPHRWNSLSTLVSFHYD